MFQLQINKENIHNIMTEFETMEVGERGNNSIEKNKNDKILRNMDSLRNISITNKPKQKNFNIFKTYDVTQRNSSLPSLKFQSKLNLNTKF